MKRTHSRPLAAALLAVGSSTAMAAPPVAPACGSWLSAATSWTDCSGFTSGNNSLAAANAAVTSELWIPPLSGALTTEYKDANPNNPLQQGNDVGNLFQVTGSASSMTLTFAGAISDPLVVSLKLGQFAAYYLFDNGFVGNTLTFSTALTDLSGYGLSHVSVYGAGQLVPSIPEPQTYALMLAGLGVMGFLARRRRPRD